MGTAPDTLINWGGWVLFEVRVCVQFNQVTFSVFASASCGQNCAHPNTKCELG